MVAYIYGRYVPVAQAAISIGDAGFVLGITATEQVRTFGGRLFELDAHLARLEKSLAILKYDPGLSRRDISQIANELVTRNYPLLAPGDDLGLGMFVTPGPYSTLAALSPPGPVVGVYTFPLPFHHWNTAYDRGVALRTTPFEQVAERSWPRELKVRSRVHYYLADQAAATAEPGARALMLDHDGFVTEATTANLLVYSARDGLRTPPTAKVLPGITLSVLRELAATAGLRVTEHDLLVDDVSNADEVLLCSTSSCVLPVARLNGQAIGTGQPGPIFRRLLNAFSEKVGLDIPAQANQFSQR